MLGRFERQMGFFSFCFFLRVCVAMLFLLCVYLGGKSI